LSLILYINGQQADLAPGTVIAQTRQVNDLSSLENRQAGYTNKFSLPKTAHNMRLMQHLTLPGNPSSIPYQKNECSLYSASGECFVYKGWAVITDGGDDFDAVIYDGIIDLYKAIEGLNLSALGDLLNLLSHEKTLEGVIDSWDISANKKYRYILADYNGETGDTSPSSGILPQVNIDYIVPSVNVAWLWEQVFTYFGIGFSGSVFDTENFKNLWMTYPKGTDSEDIVSPIFNTEQLTYENPITASASPFVAPYWQTMLLKFQDAEEQDPDYVYPSYLSYYIRVKEAGYYKMQVAGNINTQENVKILLAKNIDSTASNALNMLQPFVTLTQNQAHNIDFDITSGTFYLNANDRLSVLLRHHNGVNNALRFNSGNRWDSLGFTLNKVSLGDINFTEAFADFSIRDFLNEVVQRFGLTFFKDKYRNHYEFRTLSEILQNPDIADWSHKFSKKKSENYIYGSYAQQNWYRYAYNDKEGSYNDGAIPVPNVNLPESRDVLKSKIYSPEKLRTNYLGKQRNVYRLWDKEAVQNPAEGEDTVKYKPLDKRYCFLRAIGHSTRINLYSDALDIQEQSTLSWVESYSKLSFADILQDYYLPLMRILDKAQIVTAELWLTDADMVQLDFSRLYYIEQLSSHFILNKVNNYIPGKVTTCELVRVVYARPQVPPPALLVLSATATERNGRYRVTLEYSSNYTPAPGAIQPQYAPQAPGDLVWQDVPAADIVTPGNPVVFRNGTVDATPGHSFHLRVKDTQNNVISDVYSFNVL
jgi:hypothetical protein